MLGRNRNDSANLSVGTLSVTGTEMFERRPFLFGKGSATFLEIGRVHFVVVLRLRKRRLKLI